MSCRRRKFRRKFKQLLLNFPSMRQWWPNAVLVATSFLWHSARDMLQLIFEADIKLSRFSWRTRSGTLHYTSGQTVKPFMEAGRSLPSTVTFTWEIFASLQRGAPKVLWWGSISFASQAYCCSSSFLVHVAAPSTGIIYGPYGLNSLISCHLCTLFRFFTVCYETL